MIIVLALGAGAGLGLWALAVWAYPPRPTLAALLARATTPAPAPPILTTDDAGWVGALGRPFVAPLRAVGLPTARQNRDLAVVARQPATHLAEKASLAVAGAVAPALAQALLAVAGLSLGTGVPVVAAVALAAAGFVLPDVRVRTQASALRADFRHALSAYLDLVWIALAGGAGVDEALTTAAAIGQGWAFTRLRRALDVARLTRTTPWARLRQLGEELDVVELTELAASVSLAGTEGAKVRVSLAAKAAAVRTHQISDAESAAQSASERMSMPVMALFLGFLAFIAYPALTQVLAGI